MTSAIIQVTIVWCGLIIDTEIIGVTFSLSCSMIFVHLRANY